MQSRHHADSGASWCRVAALLLTLCLMNESGSAIPFEEFIGYPFDESNGHTAFPRELNSVRGLSIPVPFPYFGRTFSYVHIDDSGYVSLINVNGGVNVSDIATLLAGTPYAPQDFPLNTSNTILSGIDWGAVIAPYWYDADTRGNGSGRIYYKDVTRGSDPDLTEVIDTLATRHLCGFNIIWALIVTWDHVGYYRERSDKLNTFQLVLATDGRRSVAVLNYAEDGINWAGHGAVAGYNVGDENRHFKLPGSFSEDVKHIDNTTGNTGRQGQWVLLLDEAEGEEFYLAFFGDYVRASTYYLYVTTAERQPVAFTVSAPGTGYSANGTAQYGEVATFAFDASEYALSNTSDRTKAIIVRTDSHCELTVYAGDLMTGAGDSLLALSKQPDLGPNNYEYIVASYSTVPNALSLSAVAIIAQYDDTQLSISPSPHNMFGNALIQPNLELQEGETFLIESSNDLTGLLVASNKPLAVMSGHQCAHVPETLLFCDPIIEQVPPVFTWGRQFATAPLKGRQVYDVFRVVASEDPTEVMVTCSSSDTADSKGVQDAYYYKLDRRAFAEFNVPSNQHCFIQGSSNILVLQYSAGFHADNTTGDPTMITVPALTQYCNHYSLPTIGPSDGSINFAHHMNIFIPTPFYQLDQIFLNSQPLSSYNLNFTVIQHDGAPQVYATQVDLTEGVHTLYHTGPAATLGVVMYGFTFSNSYGHPGGLRLAQEIDECAGQPPCDPNASCTNTLGSFTCECNTGYSGDGLMCSDIDECAGQSPCDPNALCTNTLGSFTCECNPGYSGDGMTCYVPCTVQRCKKGNALCTKINASGTCIDRMTSCHACYFARNERPLPSQCSTALERYRCAGLTGRKRNQCLKRWGTCVKEAFKDIHGKKTPRRMRKAMYFKCPEFPC